jgi:hypothetical protein
MKTSELTGAALDWAVAQCEYKDAEVDEYFEFSYSPYIRDYQTGNRIPFTPSTNWVQGGPIIERDIVELIRCRDGSSGPIFWEARAGFEGEPGHAVETGHTPLIAAMRCYVASKLGDEVDIPEELK